MVKIFKSCSSDSYRENLRYGLVTDDGMLICSDSHTLIQYDLAYHQMNSNVKNAHNKLIHKNILKKLSLRSVHYIEFAENNIIAKNKTGDIIDKYNYSAIYCKESKKFKVLERIDDDFSNEYITFPDWKAVIPEKNEKLDKFNQFSVDSEKLKNVCESISDLKICLDITFISHTVMEIKERGRASLDRTKAILCLMV